MLINRYIFRQTASAVLMILNITDAYCVADFNS